MPDAIVGISLCMRAMSVNASAHALTSQHSMLSSRTSSLLLSSPEDREFQTICDLVGSKAQPLLHGPHDITC